MLAGEAGALMTEVELRDGENGIAKGTQAAKVSGVADSNALLNPVMSAAVYAGTETGTDVGRNFVSPDKRGQIKL